MITLDIENFCQMCNDFESTTLVDSDKNAHVTCTHISDCRNKARIIEQDIREKIKKEQEMSDVLKTYIDSIEKLF